MRSVLRWLRRLVLGALAVAVIVAVLVLVTAHTGWGREQLRLRAEAALRTAFPGGVRIGGVDGSVLGTLTIHDVELDGPDHRPLVTAGTLRVAVALWPLVVQTARIDRLVADDVHVYVRREPPAPAAPPPAPGSSPWRIELLHVELHRAVIEVDAAGATQTLTGVELAGGATVGATGVAMFGWTHATWSQRAAELTAIGGVELGGGVRVPAAVISIAEAPRSVVGGELGGGDGRAASAAIAVTGLAIDADRPRGAVAVSAPASLLARLAPALDLHGALGEPLPDLVATIEATAAAPAATRIEITAAAGEARLEASLRGEPAVPAGQARIAMSGVDLGRLTRALGVPTQGFDGPGDAVVAIDAGADRVRATVVAGEGLAAHDARGGPAGLIGPGGAGGSGGSGADSGARDPSGPGGLSGSGGSGADSGARDPSGPGGLSGSGGSGAHVGGPGGVSGSDGSGAHVGGPIGSGGPLGLDALGRARELLISLPAGGRGEPLRAARELAAALGLGRTAAPRVLATVTLRRDGARIVLEDAHVVAGAPAVTAGGHRIAGALAVVAHASGSLVPVLEVTASGIGQGERLTVDELGADGAPCAAGPRPCDRRVVELASVRGPVSVTVSTAAPRGGLRDPGVVVDVTGAVVAERVVVQDVAVAVVDGSFAGRVAGGGLLGRAHLTATAIRRGASALGAAQVDLENRGDGTLWVAATAWPGASGLALATEASVAPGPRTVARLGRTTISLPGGARWQGSGGTIAVDDVAIRVRDVTLHARGQTTRETAPEATRETTSETAPEPVRGATTDTAPETVRGATTDTAPETVRRATTETAPEPVRGATIGAAGDPLRAAGAAGDPLRAAGAAGDPLRAAGAPTIALRADLFRGTGALEVRVGAEQLAAAAFDPRARGVGRGTLDLARRGGRWQLAGQLDVAGFAVEPDAPAIDGTARLALAGSRATLGVRATGPALGTLELAAEAVAPGDPLDPEAWRRLDRGAIRRAAITARQVGVAGLAGAAGLPGLAGITGTIDGAVDLAPSALRGALAIRGVELPLGVDPLSSPVDAAGNLAARPAAGASTPGGLASLVDGDVTFAPHDGDLGVNATGRLTGVAEVDLTARFGVPEHPFDPATWRRRGRDLLKEAAGELDHVAFGPDLLARLGVTRLLAERGVTAPLRGHATVELALGAAATQARVAIELADVTGGPLVEPVTPELAVSAGPSGTHVRLAVRGGGPGHDVGLGALEADLPMTTDRWLDEPAAALRAPITGRWTLPVTQAASVLAILGRRELTSGTLEGDAAIRGTLAAPIVESARLIARDLVAAPRLGGRAPPAFADLELAATWGGASGTVTLTGREATGGQLHGFANGRPDALADATGSITTRALDLAPIAAVLPGRFGSAAGVVDAELALRRGKVTGTLHVTGGALPIAPVIGTLRDATADLAIDDRAIRGTLDGKLGRGTIHLTADTAADLTTTTAKLTLRDVSLLGALRPRLDAELDARLRLDGAQLRGDVTVASAQIVLPEHPGTPLLDAGVPADLVFAGAPAPAAAPGPRAPVHPWLDVDVALGPTRISAHDAIDAPGLDVEVISLDGTLRSDRLHVAVGDAVGVTGTVRIEDADAEILGRRYRLEPSHLEFDGTIDPRLDILMSHSFTELTLSVGVTGRVSRPDLQFSSDLGSYSHDQLFGFFIGGEPGGDPNSQTGEAVTGALVKGVSGALGRQLTKRLPVKIDAVSCAPATTSTSKSCTFGKRLSQRLIIYYSPHLQPLPSENANDLEGEFRLGSAAVLDVTGGDRGHHGADVLLRHRW
jgi:hypothetical protein